MLGIGFYNTIYTYFIFYFCIFVLSSLSGMFSERTGIINIGINGMMIIGAISYLVFSQTLYKSYPLNTSGPTLMIWQLVGVIIAAICGGLYSLLHGFATIKLKSDQTISGFAINLLAVGIAIILLVAFGNGSKTPKMLINEMAWTVVVNNTRWEIISLKVVITLIAIIVGAIMLYKTKWGLRFRSIGENPQAADVAGLNVNKYKWQGVVISGVLAGIAGSIFAQVRPSDFNGDVQGVGFIALAIMIMGQWKISFIVLISFIFSLLFTFTIYAPIGFESIKKIASVFQTLPYLITLIVVMVTAKKSKAPAASGVVYDKSKR